MTVHELNAFEERLLEDLLTAHPHVARAARRRRTARRGAAVVAAAAAILAVPVAIDVVVGGYEPSTGVLAIAEAEGGVVVSVDDVTANEEQMNRQLAESGVPATVKTMPVSPFLVGRFIGVEAHGPRGQRVAMQAGQATEVFIPRGVEAGLILHVGRTPEPGEPPSASVSVFHPGEMFGCEADLIAANPDTVEEALRARGVTRVEWDLIDGDTSTDYRPERPDRGYFRSANVLPGDATAYVVIATDPDNVPHRLPPEC